MPAKPQERPPEWADDVAADVVDPGTVKQATGFVANENPSAGHVNWVLRTNGEYDNWAQHIHQNNVISNDGDSYGQSALFPGPYGFSSAENEHLYGYGGDSLGRTIIGAKHGNNIDNNLMSYQFSRDKFCARTIPGFLLGHAESRTNLGTRLGVAPGAQATVTVDYSFVGACRVGLDEIDNPNTIHTGTSIADRISPVGITMVEGENNGGGTGQFAPFAFNMNGWSGLNLLADDFVTTTLEKPKVRSLDSVLFAASSPTLGGMTFFAVSGDNANYPTSGADVGVTPWTLLGTIGGLALNIVSYDVAYSDLSPGTATVLAKSPLQDLYRSTDGGLVFAPVAGTDLFSRVRWMGGTTWVGFGPALNTDYTAQETIYVSNDDGINWGPLATMPIGWSVTEMSSDLCGTWMATIHKLSPQNDAVNYMFFSDHREAAAWPLNFKGCETMVTYSFDQGCTWVAGPRMGLGAKLEGYWGGGFHFTGSLSGAPGGSSRLLANGDALGAFPPNAAGTQHLLSSGSAVISDNHKSDVTLYTC